MEPRCRDRIVSASTALVLVLTFGFSPLGPAQVADSSPLAEATNLNTRNDTDPARNEASDLLIATHDVSGKIGTALALKIKLVRLRNVYIETVKLLGLPRGVTINDSYNTFSSSSDNNDVDVSSWDLSDIWITQSDQRESNFPLAVAAIWTPETGGHINVTSSRLNVDFISNTPVRTVAAASDDPDNSEWRAAETHGSSSPLQADATAASLDAPASYVFMPEPVPVAPRESTSTLDRSTPLSVIDKRSKAKTEVASLPRLVAPALPPAEGDRLVERARGLIRLGDISGARLLLVRAQTRNAPNATFLLAQTYDPKMLRIWKVRGLHADPDLARSLYAKAAERGQTDERQLAATSR